MYFIFIFRHTYDDSVKPKTPLVPTVDNLRTGIGTCTNYLNSTGRRELTKFDG